MNRLDEIFAAARNGTLKLEAVVITDWRDGPTEGIARLSVGDELWKFKLFADDASTDDLSDRLFLLAQLPKGLAEAQRLEEIANARLPLVWPFSDRSDADSVRLLVDFVLESAVSANLVVSATSFDVVEKMWIIEF